MILILAFLAWRHRHFMTPKRFGVVFMLTCLVAVTVIASVPQAYVDRLLTLKKGVSMESDTAMQRRSRYIVVAFDSFKNNPILGTGTDTFGTVWQYSKEAIKFKMSSRDAHNTYLEVLVGSGLLGLVLFFVIIVKSYRNFVHAERIFARIGNNKIAALTGAYKLSFVVALIYLMVKSGIDFKLFLLSISVSHLAMLYAREHSARHESVSDEERIVV